MTENRGSPGNLVPANFGSLLSKTLIMSTDAVRSTGAYTSTAVALHWLIAGLMVSAFALGWVMTELLFSPLKVRLFNWHKWVGITVLGLAIARVLWLITHPAPPLLPMPAWQRTAAYLVHGLLYLSIFALPLSGWAYSSATGFPILYLGLVPLPSFVDKDRELAASLLELHQILGWLLFVAVLLHVAAALKHHFVDRDGTLKRMSWARGR